MSDIKISIIGAGSAVFSLRLVSELCVTTNLEGSTISFMDINEERLDAVHSVCRRYANEVNIDLRLEKTTNRRESIKDADFVINTALVAGHQRELEGRTIAQKDGYSYGGSHHIMHDEPFWVNFYQFRLFESIMNDVLDLVPKAWYIQLANPVLAGITYLTRKYKNANILGLCTVSTGREVYGIAEKMGMDPEYVSFEMPGVNHFIWLTHFYYKGVDALPMLDDWIRKEEPKLWETLQPPTTRLIAVDLYKRFHAYPIGDTCSPGGGAWPWWYYATEDSKKKWKLDPEEHWKRYFSNVEKELDQFLAVASDPSMKVTGVYPPTKSRGSRTGGVAFIIESIACQIPRVFQVNIMNTGGFVPGIPLDFEVEVPALISKVGVRGIKTDGLPEPLISYVLRDRVAPVELELEAYENGSKERLLELVMMDPWTRSEEQAKRLVEDILALPYHTEMKEHYS